MLTSKLIAIFIVVVFILLVVELVRRERLTFKYASGWFGVLVMALFLAVFDELLFKVSSWLGFELPSNFIFFALLCVFVFLGLLLTVFLCQQDNRNDAIAQKIGLLEFELEQLKNNRPYESKSKRNGTT